ncbi:MAG TPA: hypothetical protein VFZ53_08510 [Polyangiaceae bacterium]
MARSDLYRLAGGLVLAIAILAITRSWMDPKPPLLVDAVVLIAVLCLIWLPGGRKS